VIEFKKDTNDIYDMLMMVSHVGLTPQQLLDKMKSLYSFQPVDCRYYPHKTEAGDIMMLRETLDYDRWISEDDVPCYNKFE
jgi:hypothetical protein